MFLKLHLTKVGAIAWYSVKLRIIFDVQFERRKVEKANLHENWNSILQSSECFCQISPKFVLIILNYTISMLVCFAETQRSHHHQPLGVRWYQSPEWIILSHVNCFIQGEVMGFHVLLHSLHPCTTRVSWWSLHYLTFSLDVASRWHTVVTPPGGPIVHLVKPKARESFNKLQEERPTYVTKSV